MNNNFILKLNRNAYTFSPKDLQKCPLAVLLIAQAGRQLKYSLSSRKDICPQ